MPRSAPTATTESPGASTCLEAGFLDQPSGIGSLFLQVAGKLLGSIENGLQPDFGYPLLTERRLVADATDVLMQFLDDGFGRAGRGNEAEVNRSEIRKTQLIQGWHVGKERGARVGVHGERFDSPAAYMSDEVGQSD